LQDAHAAIGAWDSFYVIVGSSGAALTGLQFVVMALIKESDVKRVDAIDAFGTPTIVHFCTALLLSAVLAAPWRLLSSVAAMLGFTGLAGLGYLAIVFRRARAQRAYKPVFEDWLWHSILPLAAHGTLVASAIALYRGNDEALFPIAALTLLLLFIGIHNAWDTVVYIALDQDRVTSGNREP
jgi:hypothetical protein